LLGNVEYVERGASTDMRTAHEHADAFHFTNDSTSEVGQAPILGILTTSTHRVADVVDQQHPAHTEVVIQLDEFDALVQRVGPFDVEEDPELALELGRLDVLDAADQGELVIVPLDPAPEPGELLQVHFGVHLPEADVE